MSDASAGQIVGGVVGAVAGFIVGGGPVGAVQGFAIGYGIGGYIDPPDGPYIKAPTLDDQTFQSSAYGTDIPTIDGTVGLNGNVIYLENGKYKQVTTSEEQGGKGGGGGATVESVKYFATFAVSLCEAVPGAAIRRVWLGGKVIYNLSESGSTPTQIQSAQNAKGFQFYDGTQTEPDDRIESVLPAGEAESYEGTAYIIFKDLDLGPYGNSMQGCPVKVELVKSANNTQSLTLSEQVDFTNDEAGLRTYNTSSFLASNWFFYSHTRVTPYVSSVIQRFSYVSGAVSGYTKKYISDENISNPPEGLNDGGITYTTLHQALGLSKSEGGVYYAYQARGVNKNTTGRWAAFGTSGRFRCKSGLYDREVTLAPTHDVLAVHESESVFFTMDSSYIYKYRLDTSALSLTAQVSHTINTSYKVTMWHSGGRLWVGTTGSFSRDMPNFFYTVDDDFSSVVYQFGLPVRNYTSVYNGGGAFAVIGPMLYRSAANAPTGQTGTFHYEQWAIDSLSSYSTPLNVVASEIASRSGLGLSLFDSSALVSDYVRGYIRPVGDGRGALSQLQAAFLFDVVQIGYKLKAVKRGADPVLTIPYGDLGAKKSGSAPVDRLGASRQMDTVLPSKMEVRYLDALREYDKGSQSADYPTSSFNVKQVDFALSLNNDEAAKLADVLINAAWSERTKFNFSLPQSYLSLIVSDVVNIETPDRTYQVRIESINTNENQTLQVAGALSAPALWESDAKGAEGVIPDDNVKFVSDSQAVLIDTAMIFNSTDQPGIAAQMSGGESWDGGSLLRSIDGGQTYSNLSAFTTQGAAAVANNTLGESDGFVIERNTELNVSVLSGEFSSITEAQMMNGQHWCAYGADGRWEVFRFTEATLNADESLTLSGFVRGARGTEWATGLHVDGDLVVLLDGSNTQFITADIERIGVNGNYKAVTFGQSALDVTGEDFTYRGENLKPLSPVLPVGNLTGDDWSISATTRTRYSGSFWVTGVQPINESVLAYELDILDGATVVRTLSASSLDFTYTLAQQVDDFGAKQTTIIVKYYQISDRVGRSLALSAEFDATSILDFSNVSLVAAYTMDSIAGAVINDESPNGNNGLLSGAADQVAGYIGQALDFDGVLNWIELDSVYPVIQTGSFSVSVWFNTSVQVLPFSTIFSTHTASYSNAVLLVIEDDGTVQLRGGSSITSTQTFDDGAWHHAAITLDGVGKRLYVDGLLIGSDQTQDPDTANVALVSIGQDWDASGGGTKSDFFNGLIDQFRLFNRALTQEEVVTLANET